MRCYSLRPDTLQAGPSTFPQLARELRPTRRGSRCYTLRARFVFSGPYKNFAYHRSPANQPVDVAALFGHTPYSPKKNG
jgi:hypothetical protein